MSFRPTPTSDAGSRRARVRGARPRSPRSPRGLPRADPRGGGRGRPRRRRDRPRRRRDLHARLPRGLRALRTSRLGRRPLRPATCRIVDVPPTEHVRSVRPLRPARRPRRLPRRGRRRARSPRRRSTRSRCSGWALDEPEEVRAVLEALYDRVAPGGFVVVDGYGAADCQAAVDAFRAERGVAEPLERIDWSGAAWRKGGGRQDDPEGSRAASPAPRANRDQGPGGGRRRPQHAPRGGPDPALALAQLPAGHRRPRLRGDRGRERVRPRAAARRGVRAQLRPRVPLHRPRRTTRRPRPRRRVNRGIAASTGRNRGA